MQTFICVHKKGLVFLFITLYKHINQWWDKCILRFAINSVKLGLEAAAGDILEARLIK